MSQATHQQEFVRFKLAQRIEHIVLLLSFSTLALTGLIQKYSLSPVCDALIRALGGIETTRLIHHGAAVVFTLQTIYHFVLMAYKVFVLHNELTMLPGVKDALDGLNELRYNLGLARQRPVMPRYNYVEKMEYWAMIWGTLVMAATGFMLWNPIFIARLFPGQVIPAAKAAHGGEAVLAVLAIFVWHMYSVHLKRFNKAMWTGKMSREEMEEEHGQELARLERGDVRPLPSPAVVRRRQRIFVPVMAPIALLLVGGVVWLTNFEKTAITTVPPQSMLEVFSPLPTASAAPSSLTTVAAAIPHDVVGKEQCDTCHGSDKIKPYPADHVGRPNESCQACHKPGSTSTQAPAGQAGNGPQDIPHPIVGRENCEMCHAAGGVQPVPADHEGRTSDTCTACHKLSPGISGTPEGAATPEAGTPAPAGGGPNAIPHDVTADLYKDCTTCHGAGKIKPFPTNHAAYTADMCTACHKPALTISGTGTEAPAATATVFAAATPEAGTPAPAGGGPNAIPHDVTADLYKDCTTCHGAGKIKPFPTNHAAYTADMCTACHKPALTISGTGTPAVSAATPAAAAPILPTNHDLTSSMFKDNCLNCHAAGKLKPFPATHSAYTVDSCTACHQAAGG